MAPPGNAQPRGPLLASCYNDEKLVFEGFCSAHRDDLERIQAEEFKRRMPEKRKREAEETTIMLYQSL
jgi:hypothetical protein